MARPYLLTLEYPPQRGGVAKYLEGEVKASNVPVVVQVVDGSKWKSLIWRARRGFRGCDYLWLSHILPIGYVALVWKWVYKTPYRVYLHGLDLVRPRQSKWKTFWVKIILQNADEIVVNSNATKKLLDYYGIGISGRNAINRVPTIRIQYPRIEKVNTEQYKPLAEKLRQQYQITDKPVLLTISRLVKRKGIDLVIKSLPVVWQEIPDLVYVVVGEGEERENLEKTKMDSIAPQDAGLQNDRILFVGPVSEEEKYGWLSTCDCFILTPIDDPNDFEGYGIVYKEAQMFNKPVIGSRVGGVPEAIGDGTLIASNDISAISRAIIDIFRK